MSKQSKYNYFNNNHTSNARNSVTKTLDMKAYMSLGKAWVTGGCIDEKNGYDYNLVLDLFPYLYNIGFEWVSRKTATGLTHLIINAMNIKETKYLKEGGSFDRTDEMVRFIMPTKFGDLIKITEQRTKKFLIAYLLTTTADRKLTSKELLHTIVYSSFRHSWDIFQSKISNDKKELTVTYPDIDKISLTIFHEIDTIKDKQNLIKFYNANTEIYSTIFKEYGNDMPSYFKLVEDGVEKWIEQHSEFSDETIKMIRALIKLSHKNETDTDKLAEECLSEDEISIYKELMVLFDSEYNFAAEELTHLMHSIIINAEYLKEKIEHQDKINSFEESLKQSKSNERKLGKNAKQYKEELRVIENKYNQLKSDSKKFNNLNYIPKEINDKTLAELDKAKQKILDKETELADLKQKLDIKESRIYQLEDKLGRAETTYSDIELLEAENKSLKHALLHLDDTCENIDTKVDLEFEAIKDKKLVIVGGLGSFGPKLQQLFNNIEFIDIAEREFGFTIPENTDCVLLYTKVMTHSHKARVLSLLKNRNTPILYLNVLNIKLVIAEVYKHMQLGRIK